MGKQVIFNCKGIDKSFGVTHAVDTLSLEIYKGEILGLIGENGSGKSTLSSIFAGALEFDSGEMFYDGKKYKPSNMVEAQKTGIGMIVQEQGTIPNITVAENIFVGKEERFIRNGIVRKKQMNQKASEILEKIGADYIKGDMLINDLDFEGKKLVEIARALYDSPELFIVDETTTALAHKGRELLYKILNTLRKENKSVLFISHDLQELKGICDRVVVLRDGRYITSLEQEEITEDNMRTNMIGRELDEGYYRTDYEYGHTGEVALRFRQVTIGRLIQNVDFQVHRGEILGIGGLSDCGMHDLGYAAFGAEKLITGKIILEPGGIEITSPDQAVKNNIAYISKNRDTESLVLSANIKENIVLPFLRKISENLTIKKSREDELSDKAIRQMSIRCKGREQEVSALSGGNKQKVVFAKWLSNQSDIFIMDCPTRGIDVGVKANMYSLMHDLKKQGKAIIMISEELPELIGMSDRIILIKNGMISGEFTRRKGLSESEIIEKII